MAILQPRNVVKFNPEDATHRNAYASFMMEGKWPIAFELEYPFTSIPAMVMFKLANYACLGVCVKIDEKTILGRT